MAIEVTSIREKRRLPRLRRTAFHKVREQSRRARAFGLFVKILSVTLAVAVGLGLVAVIYLYRTYANLVDERLASGYLTSRAGLYAAPRTLREGQGITRERLTNILKRAGYVEAGDRAETSVVWSGRFSVEGDAIVIEPRHSPDVYESSAYGRVRVEFDSKGRIGEIRGDGEKLDEYALAPEPLAQDASMKTGERPALVYEEIPPVLAKAILSIEDRRFFEHSGLDYSGILRALLSWSDGSERKQGGSTITQQLVKNTYLTPERTLKRKVNEAVLATVLESRLSKQDIFALYCNEIYLGQRGSVAVRGVEQAARIYFGKELKDLTLSEAATIAGMIQSPARHAPDRNPDRARLRRNTVLDAMLRDSRITRAEAEAASNEPIKVVPPDGATATAPYFVDYVNRTVESRYASNESEDEGDERNLRVYTTIDLELQQIAEEAIAKQLDRLEKVFKGKRRPEAALVALDPHTGRILAMVGGSSYAASQLNRATDAKRQPGSVFKPVVYAAAIESGVSPISLSTDAPREFQYGYRATYRPANYGGAYSMRDVTLRDGLVRSLNVVTVDVAMRTGLERVAEYAEKLGLPRPEAYPALALGTTEATPLEVASAYAAFANGGSAVRPASIALYEDVLDSSSARAQIKDARMALKPATSYMITDMLSAVIERGTARAARGSLKGAAFAGKTGTSRDGWFAGYTPNLVCVVWVGFDDGSQLGLTGADSALPAWVDFMQGALAFRPELGGESFTRPASIQMIDVDPETGLRASPDCKTRERAALTPAHSPHIECLTHFKPYEDLALVGEDAYNASTIAVELETMEEPQRTKRETESPPPRAPKLPPVYSSVTVIEPPPAPARTERDRKGRPVLTNELRVQPSDARVKTSEGKSDWDR